MGAQSCFMCCLGKWGGFVSSSFLPFLSMPELLTSTSSTSPLLSIFTKVIILRIPEQNSGPSGSWQKPPQFPLATSVFYSNLSTRCYQKKFLKPWLSQPPKAFLSSFCTLETSGVFEVNPQLPTPNPQLPTPTPVVSILVSTRAITCQ